MTIIFSLIGLIAYRTGKIPNRGGYYNVEGEWVRKLGLIVIVIDWLPLLFLLLTMIPSALSLKPITNAMIDIGTISLFFSPMLNILILACASLLFGNQPKD
jgi:hypothetical protein